MSNIKKMNNKKSQMEILGLVVIVILFSLGLLFALRYVILKPQSTAKEAFIQAQLSSNTLSAFLKTNAPECRNADMTELFRDCGAFPSLDCDLDGSSVTTDGLADSCNVIKTAFKKILAETLDVWKVNYNFTAYNVDGKLDWTKDIGYGNCGPLDEGKPQQFTIPTDAGDLTLELKIC